MGNTMSEGEAAGRCPVNHGTGNAASPQTPAPNSAPSPPGVAPADAAGCPVPHVKSRGTVYNVYAQPIDPTNQMPATAAQQKAPGQVMDLSVTRVQSSIQKGGTDSTWLYPSPQMFWNALVRKNKADGVHESDMDTVVSIHNEMNERAWRQLLDWEALHAGEHQPGEPSLRRFMGKPHDLSPKAKLKSYFGYGFPFDRHDWYVDRGGKEVRYVIDYYFNPEAGADVAGGPVGAGDNQLVPKLTKSIFVDVRPAVDDATSFIDRLRRFPERFIASFKTPKFYAEGLDPAKQPKEAAAFALSAPSAPHGAPVPPPTAAVTAVGAGSADRKEDEEFVVMDNKCKPLLEKLKTAGSPEDRQSAHIALNYCMASVVCPNEARSFMEVMEKGAAPAEEEARFAAMSKCVLDKMMARAARDRAGATAGAGGAQPPQMK